MTLLIAGAIVTKLVDFLRGAFDPQDKLKGSPVWIVVAVAVGLTVAFVWQIHLPTVAHSNGAQEIGVHILAGLGIAATASGFHELFSALSGVGNRGGS